MKLGIGSYAYAWSIGVDGYPPEKPLKTPGLLAEAHELGLHVVQYCDNLPLEYLLEEELEALIQQARDWDIDIEVGTRGIGLSHLRRYLKLARQCASPICRVVVDTPTQHPTFDEIVAALRRVMPEFEAAGVCLAVENHDRFHARELVELIERVDSPAIGICLDTTNSFGALEGPDVVVETLAPYVVNLHVKDFMVKRVPYSMGFTIEGRPAGNGQLNVPWLLESVRQSGRDFNAIIELWPPPEADLADTIRKEQAWARESVRNMRMLIPG